MRRLRVSIGVAGLLLGGVASATPPRLAVLDVRATGVDPALEPALVQTFVTELAVDGIAAVPPATVERTLRAAGQRPGCLIGPCLAGYVTPLDSSVGLVVDLDQEGTSYRAIGTLLDLRGGVPVAQITESCDVCQIREAVGMMRRTADSIAGRVRDTRITAPATSWPVTERVVAMPSPALYRRPVRDLLYTAAIAAIVLGIYGASRWQGVGGPLLLGAGGLCLGSALTLSATAPEEAPPPP